MKPRLPVKNKEAPAAQNGEATPALLSANDKKQSPTPAELV